MHGQGYFENFWVFTRNPRVSLLAFLLIFLSFFSTLVCWFLWFSKVCDNLGVLQFYSWLFKLCSSFRYFNWVSIKLLATSYISWEVRKHLYKQQRNTLSCFKLKLCKVGLFLCEFYIIEMNQRYSWNEHKSVLYSLWIVPFHTWYIIQYVTYLSYVK